MKRMLITALILTVFALVYPVAMSLGYRIEDTGENTEALPEISSENSSSAAEKNDEKNRDADISLTVLKDDGKIYDMTMRDYLISVVAAEMPVSFEPEALKAQAIAARTYTLYNMLVRPKQSHENADVCTDYACCKAYVEPDALREYWGADFDTYIEKIASAVDDTDSKYLSCDGEIVLAVFHSSSAGRTEDASAVWNTSLPYLVSVESPETTDAVPDFKTMITVSHREFVDTVKNAYPDAFFGDDIQSWVGTPVMTDSGRVDYIPLGGIDVPGTQVRNLFGLRSAYFSLDLNSVDATFTVTGYGHGVGMSQYGANILAGEGKSCEEILEWYYRNTVLSDTKELDFSQAQR